MNKALLIAPVMALMIASCNEAAEEAPVAEEKLGDYKALGTEPGWTVDIEGEEIAFTSMSGNNFTLPIQRMKKTETGWEVRGFSGEHNINLTITTGEKCNDGMSDREYADTVKVSASESGVLDGCGGDIEEGGDSAP